MIEPGDHHVAEPVEQRGQRQQHAVGLGGQAPGRDVGRAQEEGDDADERQLVGRQRRGAAQAGQRVGARGEDDREDDQPQLGVAAQRAHDRAGRGHGTVVAAGTVVVADGADVGVVVVVVD